MTNDIQGKSHTKLVTTTRYKVIDLEPNAKYLYQPTKGLGAGRCTSWHWPGVAGSGIPKSYHYRKPCLYKDGEGGFHSPERGTEMKCDGKSMIIYDTPTTQGDSCVSSDHPAISERPPKDNIWNRSFHGHPGARTIAEELGWKIAGTATNLCRTAKSLVESCLDNFRKTPSEQESVSATSAPHDSTSSVDTIKQVKSDQGPEDGWDRDGRAFGGWRAAGGSRNADWKSGSCGKQASGMTSNRI